VPGSSGSGKGLSIESVDEMDDSRICSLTEMGFSRSQAESALREAKNDVNVAITLLLNSA
jgi:uncharacterized UBP type Zn finger protein